MLDVKSISTSDLYALYCFISEEYNKAFGAREEAKITVKEKFEEVKQELNKRAYGVKTLSNKKKKVDK